MTSTNPNPENPAQNSGFTSPKRDETRVHIPAFMPFFWLGCAVISGAVCADLLRLSWKYWAGGLAISGLFWAIRVARTSRLQTQNKLPASTVIFFLCLAGLLYQLSLPGSSPDQTLYYNEKGDVEVVGVVVAPPDQQDDTINLIIQVVSLEPLSSDPFPVDPEQVRGKVLLQVPLGSEYQYGDKLSIRGGLDTPPEAATFSYRNYLSHQGIYSLSQFSYVKLLASDQGNPMRAAIYRLRSRSQEVLKEIFPEPESALLRGILLGDESGLSKELQQAYSVTGTAHIIAISGFNMAVLAGLVTRLFTKKLGVCKGGLLAILTLALYAVLVGASASVVRAAVMGSVTILGSSIHRRGNLLNSLGLCVFLMVLFNPHLPWDIGFQLSVMATLGLGLYARPLQARLNKWIESHHGEETATRLSGPIGEYFLVTLSAQVLVLPLILYHFREVSALFLIANPLILPAQPLVMVLGLTALAGGLLWLGLGKALAWLAWPFAAYTNRMVEFLAGLAPSGWQIPRISFLWVAAYYLIFFLLTLPGKPKPESKFQVRPSALLTGLGCLTVLVWSAAGSLPDGKLNLRVLGDSEQPVVLVESAEGRYMLVGGSLPSASLAEQLGKFLPPFTRELDLVVIPACGKADVSGLFGLAGQFRIGQVLWACDPERIQTTERLYQSFQKEQVLQRRLVPGMSLDLGGGGQAYFTFSEEDLASIQLTQGDFHAQVVFDDSQINAGENLTVLITASQSREAETIGKTAKPQVTILTSIPKLEQAAQFASSYFPVRAGDYRWVEVSSDGRQFWLSGKRE
ncbi:MAG: ComEC/Rec2 family competence protein [Anaerolineaceae bacterium]